MAEDKVRLGIIGLGAEGGMYAKFLDAEMVPNMRIGAICDILPEKKEEADAYGVPFYADYKEMIDSGDVDAVVTTVPHYLHPEMGIYALQQGIHALVEKPVGVYTKQANELIEYAASKPELKFGVFFNQRTNPLYKDLKALMDSGELGKLRHTSWIITTWWRPQPYYAQSEWRATWGGEGGGVLVNQAPHQLDLWQWICGVPKSVFAKVAYGFKRDIEVEDEVNALVDFGDGATGTF
ncbi:MAG: Gfo/Idh/MocA family oxidoreductase, partial [Propioniciclava sp.]|nr:Gfo/Idh/MocA family oxidoreductase [Propioniciclava sp.]